MENAGVAGLVGDIGAAIDIGDRERFRRSLQFLIANSAIRYLCVMIKRCGGVILLRIFTDRGDDHSVSLIYEGRFLDSSSSHGSEARESECRVGCTRKQRRLAVGWGATFK